MRIKGSQSGCTPGRSANWANCAWRSPTVQVTEVKDSPRRSSPNTSGAIETRIPSIPVSWYAANNGEETTNASSGSIYNSWKSAGEIAGRVSGRRDMRLGEVEGTGQFSTMNH